MALITWLFLAYASGLWLAFGGFALAGAALCATSLLAGALRREMRPVILAGTHGLALLVAREAAATDRACLKVALRTGAMTVRLLEPLTGPASAGAIALECGVRVRVPAMRGQRLGTGSVVRVEGTFVRGARGLRVRHARVRLLAHPPLLDRARARVSAAMDRRFGTDAPLARALVIAEQYDLPADLRARYADAGIIHMVSVSGLHVSIIAGGLLAALALAGLSPRMGQGIAVAVLAGYVAFIGAPPPAVRSAAMTGLSLATRWVQRNTCPWAIWALGSGVSLVEPRTVLDLGWQLSVGGMAGLLASGGLARRWFGELDGWRQPVVEGVVATGVATVVSAPIVAWTFGRISVAALLTNLLAAPLFDIAQPLLFATVLLDAVEPVAAWCGDATRGALGLIGLVARVGAWLPGAVLQVAPSAMTALCVAVAAAGVLVACASRHWRPPAALALGAFGLAAWHPLLPPPPGGRLELHVLDVGQGDAIALRTPRGRWLLVDAGGSWEGGDAGASVVAPWLRRRGGDVVYLAMTHSHADHIGGVRSVVGSLAVDTVWDTGFPGTSPAYREALDSVQGTGTVWRRMLAGDARTFDGVRLEVLAPDAGWRDAQDNPNEASLVLRVTYGATRILLMGDAEAGEEAWLTGRVDDLRADVLKVGHHGSSTSSTPGFLARVRPRVALVSVGADNEYGHPSPGVLRALHAVGAHVLRTDDEGGIMLATDGRTLELRTEDSTWAFRPRSPAP